MVDLPIREFAYLDRERLEDFLSALVGGLPTESKESAADEDPAVDAEASLKVASLRRLGGRSRFSWEELRKATPASLFEALYRELEERTAIQNLDAFDGAVWEDISTGEFVDAPCRIELSALERLFDLFQRLKGFMDVLVPGQSADTNTQQMMQYLDLLAEDQDSINLRLVPIGGPSGRHVFVASLNKAHIRVNKSSLPGQFRVFGRVQQKLAKGETFELYSLLPQGFAVGRDQLRQLLSKFADMPAQLGKAPTMDDLRVSYPAMVLTPVAVYR